MISKIVLSCIICIVIILLTVIVINYAVFWKRSTLKSLYWIGQRRRGRRVRRTDLRVWILKRAWPTGSITPYPVQLARSRRLIRRRCFDERRYFYIRKTKGNVLQLAYKLLGTYDNKNIINYIRELVNINNTTDKNLMRCRLRQEGRRGVFKL
jgi:hypothetical protein